MNPEPTSPSAAFSEPNWRTPPDPRPDLDFVVRDLQRGFLRLADNLRWYEQTWLGVPIWQLPDDLVALQRIVCDLQPTWILETGTKFGGSALFFASLLALLGRTADQPGGVLTVDIEETVAARALLAADAPRRHALAPLVRRRLIGDAQAPEVVAECAAVMATAPGRRLIFLDDWHDGDHVHAELQAYGALAAPGDVLIVADTSFQDLADTPIVAPSAKYRDPRTSNPRVALARFFAARPGRFEVMTDYTGWGISNFPDSVLRRTEAAW